MTYPFAGTVWNARSRIIAEAIPAQASVYDFGGGEEELRSVLQTGAYVSIDKYRCTPRTIVADLDSEEWPELMPADYAVAAGLLEYLDRPLPALKKFHDYADRLIVSYCEKPNHPEAKATMDLLTFESILAGTGWTIEKFKDLESSSKHRIYFCKKS